MASFALEPLTFTPPTPDNTNPLKLIFRILPSSGNNPSDPLHPATALQFSFDNGLHEVFGERLTARDITLPSSNSPGAAGVGNVGSRYEIQIPGREVPRFAETPEEQAADVVVRVHSWKGEKLLGRWEVGCITGWEVGARV